LGAEHQVFGELPQPTEDMKQVTDLNTCCPF